MKPTDTMTVAEFREYQRNGRLPDRLSGRASGERATVSPNAETATPRFDSEKELQAACERILVKADYRRLTEKNLLADTWSDIPGWFAHWPQAVGNPIMPDFVVWNRNMTRTLMVELKVKPVFRKAQKAAITGRLWKLAYTTDEFAGILAEWIGKDG